MTEDIKHDGNTLLLFDSRLRGLVGNIADGMQRHEVRIEVEKDRHRVNCF